MTDLALLNEDSVGLTPSLNAAGSSTKVALKAAPGKLFQIIAWNPSNALAFVQFYDKLAANVTVGTTTPDWVVPVPYAPILQGGVILDEDGGLKFSTGMTYACTTTPTGSTAPSTALMLSFATK